MEKLELKHIAPYLPYGLIIHCDFKDGDMFPFELEALTIEEAYLDGCDWDYKNNTDFKPILKPLISLIDNKRVIGEMIGVEDVNGFTVYEKVLFEDGRKILEVYINIEGGSVLALRIDPKTITQLPYNVVEVLFKYHYDVFNLHANRLCVYQDELK